ncbi:MAG: hypothetical protein HYZ25_11995 [Chloroflexi bacterium]|nr:hypothetical protein [Chloroflexota bacterium]
MTQTPIIHHKAYKQRIARNTRRIMNILIAALAVPALVLMLNLGLDSWPMWLLTNRSKLLGLLLFGVVILSLLSPSSSSSTLIHARSQGQGKIHMAAGHNNIYAYG